RRIRCCARLVRRGTRRAAVGAPRCRVADRLPPGRASRSCAGAGERSDIVRNLNVRHGSPGLGGAMLEELRTSINDDIPLAFNLLAVAPRTGGVAAPVEQRRLFVARSIQPGIPLAGLGPRLAVEQN